MAPQYRLTLKGKKFQWEYCAGDKTKISLEYELDVGSTSLVLCRELVSWTFAVFLQLFFGDCGLFATFCGYLHYKNVELFHQCIIFSQ